MSGLFFITVPFQKEVAEVTSRSLTVDCRSMIFRCLNLGHRGVGWKRGCRSVPISDEKVLAR